MPDKYLIVGLGNPGREYRENRHNVGFMTLDRLAQELGLAFTRRQSDALYAAGRMGDIPLVLAKPQRYMNRSGRPVASLLKFHEIPLARLLVIFDELDLPLGTIRLRPEGGTSGHHGMESIVEALGTQIVPRLRFGIGRPPGRMDGAAYVLQDFGADEKPIVEATIARAAEAVEAFVKEGIVAAMNRFNAGTSEAD
ncbi:MAG: aminoacyl-tRNA hydrolase [Chloroflexi bacterium]|nr:aminoacyl-tRNA hydrolase [Chloroflexota bacterium]